MGFKWTGLGAAAVALSVLAAPAAAETMAYKLALAPGNEVPPVLTRATGAADLTFDTMTRVVTWNIIHSGLSGTPTAAHFHGPSTALENGPVVIVFEGSLASPFKGMTTLSPAQATAFLSGTWYINIHTQAYPGGELRAQVPKRP